MSPHDIGIYYIKSKIFSRNPQAYEIQLKTDVLAATSSSENVPINRWKGMDA